MSELTEKLGITPGPWVIVKDPRHKLWIDYKKIGPLEVSSHTEGHSCITTKNNKADAILIAAAPEMLDALINSVRLEERILEYKVGRKIQDLGKVAAEVYIYSDDPIIIEQGKACLGDLMLKVEAIEKACHPKKWNEIKEIYNEK